MHFMPESMDYPESVSGSDLAFRSRAPNSWKLLTTCDFPSPLTYGSVSHTDFKS